jgi:hypothetical protein
MTQISPNFSHEKIESASTDDLIDVLEDRVVYWLLRGIPGTQLSVLEERSP